jgi:hypothetical protein
VVKLLLKPKFKLTDLLISMYNKHGVWALRRAQTFVFRRAGNVVIGICKEYCAVNVKQNAVAVDVITNY